MSEETKAKQYTEEEGTGPETVQRDLCGETVLCEAAGDYELPDYQPEIRKVLSVRATVLPSGKYVGGSKAEFTGSVVHTVLYTDPDGHIASASLPADYDFAVTVPTESGVTVMADSMAEGSACRLSGPRKLSLRTRIRSVVHVLREEAIAAEIRGMGSAEDCASLEYLTGEMAGMRLVYGESGEFTLNDTVRLEGSGEAAHAIYAGGNLLVGECRIQENGCLVRGEAWVRCLLSDGEGTPYTVRTKIPFEQTVMLEDVAAGAQAVGYGRISAVDVSVIPGSEGSAGSVGFDVAAEVEVCACYATQCKTVLDLFSTSYEMNCHYRTVTGTRMLGSTMGNYTVSASRPKNECEGEHATAVVDADGRLEISGVTCEHGRAVVSGVVHTQVIFTSASEAGDGGMAIVSAEVPVPFRVESDLRLEGGVRPRFECHGELISVRGRIEAGAISADAEIALTVRASESSEMRVLEDAEPDRSIALSEHADRIYVCYPREEDTLWSVAARYHTSQAGIVARNGLGEDAQANPASATSLDGIHHLIIEK